MKANEAPEKIYLSAIDLEEVGHLLTELKDRDDVEYTRTDAFIEKACEWLKESVTNNSKCNRIISKKGMITMGLLIEDFRAYMEGE